MVYGEEFKVTTYVLINLKIIVYLILIFRNDFLENSRYAKIAFHVATTMETVNLNEITNDQPLAHLVNLHSFVFQNLFFF
jgi:hypothetical protein